MGVVQAGTLWLSFTVAFNLDLILAIVCAPACLILPYWTIITIEINTNMLTMIIIIMSMIIEASELNLDHISTIVSHRLSVAVSGSCHTSASIKYGSTHVGAQRRRASPKGR